MVSEKSSDGLQADGSERRCRLSEAAVLRPDKDGGRAVLINAETGAMFMLNRTGLLVCQAIENKPRRIEEIISMLENVMRMPPGAERDVSRLVAFL
ncbi:MAG: PqqD family protein, partial [Victivallales bacterium]|nr:PqqD family protein [Victivallales bacterium]